MNEQSNKEYNYEQIGQQLETIYNLLNKHVINKDQLINKLHDELEVYKKDSSNKFEEQLLKSIIKIRQDMKKTLTGAKFATMNAEELRLAYQYIYEDLTDMLEQQGCDEFTSNHGDEFNANLHLPSVEPTDDLNLDKKIKSSIKSGFKKGTKIIIPEKVIVYKYTERKDEQ